MLGALHRSWHAIIEAMPFDMHMFIIHKLSWKNCRLEVSLVDVYILLSANQLPPHDFHPFIPPHFHGTPLPPFPFQLALKVSATSCAFPSSFNL